MRWLILCAVCFLWACNDDLGDVILPLESDAACNTEDDADTGEDAVDSGENTQDTEQPPMIEPPPSAGPAIEERCTLTVGEPRVEEVAPDLFVAIGYDLANTIVLKTDVGNVVIDVSMSPQRARVVKDALMEVVPGPTVAIIYTHSHIDHIGGASVWVEEGTEIWATEALVPNLLKQYGAFRDIENFRGLLQFGEHLDDEELPCSSIGRRADVTAALETGIRLPTQTFTGSQTLEFGGKTIELVEAPGETHDQLFVWLPETEALLPGDNHYAAFPNLYTIRGTTARPVDAWIESLDAMRQRDPAILIPSHTIPVIDRNEVRARLTTYRDAIQWLRDAVVRGANKRASIDELVKTIKLPTHLVGEASLDELYGQVDWSVRAIYNNALGWFDGRTEQLYPPENQVAREIQMMGGTDKVISEARNALERGDPRWAAHLAGKLRDAGLANPETLATIQAAAFRAIADGIPNTNGRAYLLETAQGLEQGFEEPGELILDDAFIDQLPISVIFGVMPSRLSPERAIDTHDTMLLELTDTNQSYRLTVRFGVLQVTKGDPLPGTPDPNTTITTTSGVWKRLALGVVDPLAVFSDGSLQASDLAVAVGFLALFDSI